MANCPHSDDFMINTFKVEMCMLSHPHIWKTCPYVHPGEPIKRRPHGSHHPDLCPDVKKGRMCSSGPDRCSWAHNTFESWLHPQRYRTIMCRDGARCNRSICFFAHSQAQLRRPQPGNKLPSPAAGSGPSPHNSTLFIRQQPQQQPPIMAAVRGQQWQPIPSPPLEMTSGCSQLRPPQAVAAMMMPQLPSCSGSSASSTSGVLPIAPFPAGAVAPAVVHSAALDVLQLLQQHQQQQELRKALMELQQQQQPAACVPSLFNHSGVGAALPCLGHPAPSLCPTSDSGPLCQLPDPGPLPDACSASAFASRQQFASSHPLSAALNNAQLQHAFCKRVEALQLQQQQQQQLRDWPSVPRLARSGTGSSGASSPGSLASADSSHSSHSGGGSGGSMLLLGAPGSPAAELELQQLAAELPGSLYSLFQLA